MKTGKFIAAGIAVLILTSVLSCSVLAATELSKEKIIEIAKAKAIASGHDVASKEIVYREDNSRAGKGSFGVVRFWPKDKNIIGGGCEVRVNRDTGEVGDITSLR
ncbi:MAG: hypothetical protein WCJ71_09665 [Candidatus Omnitrophota bacterium]